MKHAVALGPANPAFKFLNTLSVKPDLSRADEDINLANTEIMIEN